MRIIQKELQKELRAEAVATRERISSLLAPFDASQVNEHPEPNGWSIAQVCEHLIVADELYEEPFANLMRTSGRDAGAPLREWKPSFVGKLIASSLLKPKPLKGPKAFAPGPNPRTGAVETLLSREARFVNAMDEATTLDWRALRIGSPALPSWAPKMNLGDGFRIHVIHLTRHSHQIERLARQL